MSLIDFLEASSIAKLRRACHFEGLSEHARNAELATAVLEHLEKTAFPFTHAAYVLGLNGPYYSCDTLAKNHYGIPAALPGLLCRYFRQAALGQVWGLRMGRGGLDPGFDPRISQSACPAGPLGHRVRLSAS